MPDLVMARLTLPDRIRLRWPTIAGIAWLVGFGQSILLSVGLDLGAFLLGLAMYGIWPLLLGLVLIWRPTRVALVVSALLAALVLVLYWPFLPPPSLLPPSWLSWLPEAVAGSASVVALLGTEYGHQRMSERSDHD
jgi:hypothetical protein